MSDEVRKQPGSSRTGYCKACDSSLRGEINRRLSMGHSLLKVAAYTREADYPIGIDSLRSHKGHITDPKTTLVEQARRSPAIKRASAEEFLGSLVDIGHSKVLADPSAVTVNQALKAAQTLHGKETRIDIYMQIAAMGTDRRDANGVEVIDVAYTEVKEIT